MDFLPPVVAKLVADIGEFSAKFGEAKAETEGFQAAQNRMAAAGKVAMGALAVGVAAVGYESVKAAAGFDQAMELIHTQAGASQAEVEQLKQKVLDLAPAVGIGPDALAEGLYHVESAGFRGAAALDITAAAAKDAAIGMGDMDTVSQALIGTMASGIGGVNGAADAAAYLNQIVGIGDMRMEKLAAAVSTGILPSFKSAGLQMNDFGAALATITDNATPADEAATRLRMTVSLMAAPVPAAQKALKSIGITSTELADDMRKPNGLLVAVMDLKDHLERSGLSATEQNAVIARAFGGGKTSGAILTLLGESDRLKDKYGELGTSASRAGKFQDAWASQQQQFSQQLHQLGAAAQVVGINIGNFLIPKLQGAAEWLSKHQEAARIGAVVIGGVLVAAMMAFTATLVANAAAAMADPVVWIILAIVAVIAILAIGIYELVKHWDTVWKWIKRIALDVWGWLVDAWHWVIDALETAAHWIKSKIIDPVVSWFDKYFVAPIRMLLERIELGWDRTWRIAHNILMFFWGYLSQVFNDIKNVIMMVLTPVIHAVEDTWHAVWFGITSVLSWAWNQWIQPTFHNIDKYGIQPLRTVLDDLGKFWGWVWHGICDATDNAWKGLKVFWGWMYDNGIGPLRSALDDLGKFWGWVWDGIKTAVHTTWDAIKPIFDAMGSAWDFVKGVWNTVTGDNSKQAGAAAARGAGFADGGWVPGAAGAPMLATVHGGEFVLSRDMIAGMRAGGGSTMPLGGSMTSIGMGTPPAIHIHSHVYLDGKELHQGLIRPAQRYKQRNNTTGLG